MSLPIDIRDALRARARLRSRLVPTPLRRYETLDSELGRDIACWVKHENHQPTGSFKVRNGLAVMTAMDAEARARGVVAATRGNHGLGLAWAGRELGAPVTICVPHGNNLEKNAAIRGLGATLVEEGRDYDESLAASKEIVRREGRELVHSTNDARVIAGAATMTLEMLEERPDLEALVLSVGGGSQIVGAIAVARALAPGLEIYGVQAARAPAAHDSWHAGRPLLADHADTFADGLATRSTYEMTFPAMRAGLAGFVACEEDEIAEAVRVLMRCTHNAAEGAGATGLAGLFRLRDRLAGRRVGIAISGGNVDAATLAWIFGGAPHPLAGGTPT